MIQLDHQVRSLLVSQQLNHLVNHHRLLLHNRQDVLLLSHLANLLDNLLYLLHASQQVSRPRCLHHSLQFAQVVIRQASQLFNQPRILLHNLHHFHLHDRQWYHLEGLARTHQASHLLSLPQIHRAVLQFFRATVLLPALQLFHLPNLHGNLRISLPVSLHVYHHLHRRPHLLDSLPGNQVVCHRLSLQLNHPQVHLIVPALYRLLIHQLDLQVSRPLNHLPSLP